MSFIVDYAVYGALAGGNAKSAQCVSVTSALSKVLNNPGGGTAMCGNNLLGLDPSPGNNQTLWRACQQTVLCLPGRAVDKFQ